VFFLQALGRPPDPLEAFLEGVDAVARHTALFGVANDINPRQTPG
jgi:hypothetical protein